MSEELEKMHPRIYTNVSRQLSPAPFGELEYRETAPIILNIIAKDLFKANITWSKVVSIFAVCGGFAVDCVKQQHYDYLQFLVEAMADIIEDDLSQWLRFNDGWAGLLTHIKPSQRQISFLGWLTIFVSLSTFIYFLINVFKLLGCHVYSVVF